MTFRTFTYWVFAFLLVVLGLVIWRYDILAQRPYWSSALGVFTEASALTFGDVTSDQTPAPAALKNSFVPLLVAGAMKVLAPGTPVILAARLFTFASAALVLVLLVGGLHRRLGWGGGIITAAVVLTTPAFAVQTEQLGQEIPLAMLVVLATTLLFRKATLSAALVGLLAFAAKWTGVVYLAAATIFLFLRGVRFGFQKPIIRGIIAHLIGLGIASAVLYFRAEPGFYFGGWVPPETFGTGPLVEVWRWAPDLLIITGLTIVLVVAVAQPVSKVQSSEDFANAPRSKPITFWDQPILFSVLFVILMSILLGVVGAVPANLAVLVPFIVVPLGWVTLSSPTWRLLGMCFMFLLLGFNLVNSAGMFYPPLAGQGLDWRTGPLRERSREYLFDDHVRSVEAVRAIVKSCRDKKIVAPPPFVQFLSLPALGYVVEPFEGYSTGDLTTKRFPSIKMLEEESPTELAVVALQNRYTKGHEWIVPPMEQGDTLVYPSSKGLRSTEEFKRSPLLVYVLRKVPSEDDVARQQRYIRRFWPTTQMLMQARQYIELGQLKNAEIVLRKLLESNPSHNAARLQLGVILDMSGKPDLALQQYDRVAVGSPQYRQALLQSAFILGIKEQFEESDNRFGKALAEFQRSPGEDGKGLTILYLKWAAMDIKRSEWNTAREKLEKALQLDPKSVNAIRDLGLVLLKLGRFEDSRSQLDKALSMDPKDSLTHMLMGAVLVGLKKWEEARAEFTEALRLSPDFVEAQDGLGTVLVKLGRYDEAVQEYQDALARDPGKDRRAELLRGMADAFVAKGSTEAAINALRQAVEANPDSADAANQLAWILATASSPDRRNGSEAVQFAERATKNELAPSVFFDTLAAAYAEAGEWDKAVAAAERAIAKANDEKNNSLADEFRARAELYRRKEAYHEAPPANQPSLPPPSENSSPTNEGEQTPLKDSSEGK
ncbi:tetratricopeptide repeat protein [bacterium]|nr:tetratricopeptide repeat protein [bacterium]